VSTNVLDTGMLPIINTGIAHRQAAIRRICAGITTAPMNCFIEAIDALAGDAAQSVAP
jgi:hypothetical protein